MFCFGIHNYSDSLTSIGVLAFEYSGLTTVFMSNNVRTLLDNGLSFGTNQSFYGKDGVTIIEKEIDSEPEPEPEPIQPSDIQLSNNNVVENANTETVIGTFSTTDDDSNVHTYTLNTSDVPFKINGNVLQTSGALDYETKKFYNINVTTTDNNGLSYEKEFTINVLNVNETPTHIQLTKTNIDEDVISGTVVGTFSTTDPDSDDSFSYTLNTSGVPFDISGNTLITKEALDYETQGFIYY